MFSSSRSQSSVLSRTLLKPRGEVNMHTFSYLFSELIQYCQARVSNIGELERRLDTVGFGVGIRLVELLVYRERNSRRDIRILDALRFVHSTLWRYLFGRTARDLEQSNNAEDEYMISDADLFVTRYVSVPRELGQLNCAAFVAGIIRGSLTGSGFSARVTAHNVAIPDQDQTKTTFLIKFDPEVLERERQLPAA